MVLRYHYTLRIPIFHMHCILLNLHCRYYRIRGTRILIFIFRTREMHSLPLYFFIVSFCEAILLSFSLIVFSRFEINIWSLLYRSHVNEWLLHIFHLVLHIRSSNVSISSEISFLCTSVVNLSTFSLNGLLFSISLSSFL